MLRILMFTAACTASASLALPVLAQDVTPAPDSLAGISAIERAAREAGQLLDIPDAPDLSLLGDIDIPEWNDLLKTLPQLREVLPLDGALDPIAGNDEDQGPSELSEYGVVLVSFSMPDEALRQLSEQARTYGFSTVFRGLVNNSFADTQEKLTEVFEGDTADMPGVSIDPTAFVRFDVEAVPAFIFLEGQIEPCESQGCATDPAPAHDIVYGNVSFQYAAELVMNAGGPGSVAAQTLLSAQEVTNVE